MLGVVQGDGLLAGDLSGDGYSAAVPIEVMLPRALPAPLEENQPILFLFSSLSWVTLGTVLNDAT